MRFIGCKENLLPFIQSVVEEKGISSGVFCDIFTGTTSVAKHFKKRGFKLITNDHLRFSYVLQKTYIENNDFPKFEILVNEIFRIKRKCEGQKSNALENIQLVIYFLNKIPGKEGFFAQNYAPNGNVNVEFQRNYFTARNAQRIDSIRQIIEDWKTQELISEIEYYVLIASLIEAVPFVSNISGTYGAFLKEWDPRAHKDLTLKIPEIIPSLLCHQVFCEDSNKLISDIVCDVLYIDPPYNTRQFAANYHISETIAAWGGPKVRGKTGLRPYDRQKSRYCVKGECITALEELIGKARSKHILLSYNPEGIIPHETIVRILSDKGKVEVFETSHRRFKSHSKGKPKGNSIERLYYVDTMHKAIVSIPEVLRDPEDVYFEFYRALEKKDEGKKKLSRYGVDMGPRGVYDKRNKLNDLTGKEWVYFLNSVEVTSYPTHGIESYGHNLRKNHPSPKPPQLMKKIIEFFTKEGQNVLDPFMGVGGTLIGCSLSGRQGVGIDLSEKYIDIYRKVCDQESLTEQVAIRGNSKLLREILQSRGFEEESFDLLLTDPPYGNMMTRKRTGERKKKTGVSEATPFTDSKEDIGNLPLNEFLDELKGIVENALIYVKPKKYVILFAKDFQPSKEYHNMLHADVIDKLSKIPRLVFKGYKIWYDKTINLYPYGYPFAFVPNQLHQFILIFRKE